MCEQWYLLKHNSMVCLFVLCYLVYWQVPAQLHSNRIRQKKLT